MLDNPLVAPIISSLFTGIFITIIATMIINRTSIIHYTTNIQHTALSGEDQVFGKIQVNWQGSEVNNIYIATIDVQNSSTHDFENVQFTVYTGEETLLLSERTALIGTPYIIKWSDEFQKVLTISKEQAPTQVQIDLYYHRREYAVPVFNRGSRLQFTYLCTVPKNDVSPLVNLDSSCKGLKLKFEAPTNYILGIPGNTASLTGIIIALIVLVVCGLILNSKWLFATVCLIIGLFAQLIGALMHKSWRYIRELIAG